MSKKARTDDEDVHHDSSSSAVSRGVLDELLADLKSEISESNKKEVEGIREEYNKLMKDPLLGLDQYCGGCSWSGKTTCDTRVQFLKDTYNTRPIAAKLSAMGHPGCKPKK